MQENTLPENSQPAPQSQRAGVPIPVSQPVVTYILLAVNVLVFVGQMILWQTSDYGNPLVDYGIFSFRALLHGEYYRLFTAMFLHADIAHIALNGYALYIFGQTVERFFGHVRFALIYFLGGLFGMILEFVFRSGFVLGASGAIFAIFGAEIVFFYRNRELFGESAQRNLRGLGLMALINFAFGLYTQIGPSPIRIGLAAHVGGFIVGLALGWFMTPRYRVESAPTGFRVMDQVSTNEIWIASAATLVVSVIVFIVTLTIYRT